MTRGRVGLKRLLVLLFRDGWIYVARYLLGICDSCGFIKIACIKGCRFNSFSVRSRNV